MIRGSISRRSLRPRKLVCNRLSWLRGMPHERPLSSYGRMGIDLFLEDGAYTTLASAVAILVVLTLLFSSATAVWSMSRAGDTQVAADATALAGANVVASYQTTATVVDASILSLGLTGFCVTGAGLVGLLIPGVNAAANEAVACGIRMLKMRNEFATSASKGLQKLEGALPYLVAANSASVCGKQATDELAFSGVALAVPRSSDSDFPAIEGAQIDTDGLENISSDLDAAAQEFAQASEKTAKAKEAAWLADCGSTGMNMYERVGRLSQVSAADNPRYASSIAWPVETGLERARAYYRWRSENDSPENDSDEAKANSASRKAFYGYAFELLADAKVEETDAACISTVPLLPKNRNEIRETTLYTDALWPTTNEESGLIVHYASSCGGAHGAPGPTISLSQAENMGLSECPSCHFGLAMLGNTPAASTSISNGFEYHLRKYTQALDEYAVCRTREIELEKQTKDEASKAADTFQEALSKLAGKRPRIAPPGRYGCVAAVVSGELTSPDELESSFATGTSLARRGAISAAALAPDKATAENNVLSKFFSSLEEHAGRQGVVGLVGDVMDLWGKLLVSYGDIAEGASNAMDSLFGGMDSLGAGPVATWLGDALKAAVTGLGFEPVDLSLKKPVLTDSKNVIAHTDVPGIADVQNHLRSLAVGTTDPGALLQAFGYQVDEYIAEATFTLAEIPLPGGRKIPLTIRLKDLKNLAGD